MIYFFPKGALSNTACSLLLSQLLPGTKVSVNSNRATSKLW